MSNRQPPIANGLSIVPRSLTMIPGNRQTFTLVGEKQPAVWGNTDPQDGASINSNFTATVPLASFTAEGVSAYNLVSGTGRVYLVIEEDMFPASDGYIRLLVETPDNDIKFFIDAMPTQLTVNNAETGILETITHTLLVGDVIEVEITGNTFYAKLNFNYLTDDAQYSPGDGVPYPVSYTVQLFKPEADPDHVLRPPVIIGDWQIGSTSLWTMTPNIATSFIFPSVPPITDLQIVWEAPNKPASYTLRAALPGVEDFPGALEYGSALAFVDVPTLKIKGPKFLEVDPEVQIKLTTNYDTGRRRDLLIWTADDGTFDDNILGLYTTPNAVGDYVLRVTFTLNGLTQFAEVTIRVKKVMTPQNLCAVIPGEEIEFATNISGTKTWSIFPDTPGGGTLSTTSGANTTWTAPEQLNMVIRVQVTNGTDTLFQDITVLEVLPIDFNLPYQSTIGPVVLAEVAADAKTVWARTISQADFNPEALRLRAADLDNAEVTAMVAFHHQYKKSQRPFFIVDGARERRMIVRMDSDLETDTALGCATTLSWRVVKVGCPFV